MNSRLVFSVLASAVLVQAQAPSLPVINTPSSVVQCLPSLLTFSGGVPPYTITAIPGGQVDAAPLADLGSQSGSSYTWNVNLQAGTAISLQIRDSKGVIGYSQAVTVQPNSDSSCLGKNPSSSPAPTGSATPSPAGTNSSASKDPSASSSSNQTKSPSVSTQPTTSGVSNSSSASTKAPSSSAPGTTVHCKGVISAMAVAGAALTMFA